MKLNKTQTIHEAQKTAISSNYVTLDAEAILAIGQYSDRKAAALAAAKVLFEGRTSTDVPYGGISDSWVSACTDAILDSWGRKVRRAQDKQDDFDRACRGEDIETATNQVKELLKSFNLRGTKDGHSEMMLVVERSFTLEGRVTVRFDSTDTVIDPSDDQHAVTLFKVTTEISWPSTRRTVAESVAAIKLYTELTEVAAEVESVMSRVHVIRERRFGQ